MSLYPEIEKYIAENRPSRILVRYLTAAPGDIRNSINKILKISSPNPATLKQLVELSLDINSKMDLNPLADGETIALIKNSGVKDALKKLRRTRMPRTSKIISEINHEIQNAGLKILKIDIDQNFESSNVILSAEISSLGDADILKKELNGITTSGMLEKIIKKYKNG